MPRFKPDDQIGRYTIVEMRGAGGLGEVYLATDSVLGRNVVIKCIRAGLLEELRGDEDLFKETRARFFLEGKALGRLNHPNTCTLFDFDIEHMILVMEFIEGTTLAELNTATPFSRPQIVDVAISIAESLEDAHKKSVVHRDLTLRNVMLTSSGSVKVLDFGLAKIMDEKPFSRVTGRVGTPGYRSKEQELNPRDVDARTDIFALGVVIYRLVTGKLPYVRTFDHDPNPESPPMFEDFGIPAWPQLEKITRTALQPEAKDRFQTISHMLLALLEARSKPARDVTPLCFIDTHVLLENICPPGPGGEGRQRRAIQEFGIQVARGAAVTSAGVMAELLEAVPRLLYDSERENWNRDIRELVEAAREKVRIHRDRENKAGLPPWDQLSISERRVFLSYAQILLESRICSLSSQLTAVPSDNSVLARHCLEFLAWPLLPERDAHILSEACALGSAQLVSERGRYDGAVYSAVLRRKNQDYYEFYHSEPRGLGMRLPKATDEASGNSTEPL